MKKLIAVLFTIAIVLLLSNAYAIPIVSIVYNSFSDFDELRYMVKNATDQQLHDFLNEANSPYYYADITNREKAREFIDSVNHSLIPVLPDSENATWEISIPQNEGSKDHLIVNYWYPGRESILFYSYYVYDREEAPVWAWIKENNPDAFDSPTAEKNGVKYYQLIDFYLCDFVIVVDDYVLTSLHQHRETPEEKLNEILKFSFVRLDGSKTEENIANPISETAPPTGSNPIFNIAIFLIVSCALFKKIKKSEHI